MIIYFLEKQNLCTTIPIVPLSLLAFFISQKKENKKELKHAAQSGLKSRAVAIKKGPSLYFRYTYIFINRNNRQNKAFPLISNWYK
jgi:hypothetical protein